VQEAKGGLETVEVVYKIGADTLNDLRSGALDYSMYDPTFAMAQHRNGVLRLLGVNRLCSRFPSR
jgi:hypothetical protein